MGADGDGVRAGPALKINNMLKMADNPPVLPEGIEALTDLAGDWWVAHTKARAEKSLAWDFLALSIPYFLPMTQKTAVWGGRKRKILVPIFPSYVFFAGGERQRYLTMTTNRVCRVMTVLQRDRFVDELEAIRKAMACPDQLSLYPFAAVGRRCRVAKGPLQGIEGIVIRIEDSLRIVLEVSMLGQGASLEITADLLESV
jgi:transcription antitermination factor NusG